MTRRIRAAPVCALLFLACSAPQADAPAAAPANQELPLIHLPEPSPVEEKVQRGLLDADPEAFQLIDDSPRLSLHKPMSILPVTWSEDYHGRRTEMLFQLSLKYRLLHRWPVYFGYTQKSFFDIYDSSESKPFRESDYNPELFYRYIHVGADGERKLGADAGIEHESNGKGLPDSRSWNRLYLAPFYAEGTRLVYWKLWWRIPEDKSLPRDDPNRDDNPDIGSYYGYSELHYEQRLFGKQMAHLMARWNPSTGHAAASLQYSIPSSSADPDFFWYFYLWQGYGESLIDYKRSITRVGVGVALAR